MPRSGRGWRTSARRSWRCVGRILEPRRSWQLRSDAARGPWRRTSRRCSALVPSNSSTPTNPTTPSRPTARGRRTRPHERPRVDPRRDPLPRRLRGSGREARVRPAIVHELAHLQELHHTPEFWRLVERVMPEYESRKRLLGERGAELAAW
ncbi:MAG: M48 family metallopeptidase [Deltaproteobacteria bacterium]|nr:M48 family metallopeptidase [Deltaproteobacteria bacterium]